MPLRHVVLEESSVNNEPAKKSESTAIWCLSLSVKEAEEEESNRTW